MHSLQVDRPYLTDAGLETDIIYNEGIELPHFASIVLLREEAGRRALERYFRRFIAIAEGAGTGLILESATWRANRDWAGPLGLSEDELARLNQDAVRLLLDLKREAKVPLVASGCIGPRGDGYDPGRIMSRDEAAAYHCWQARIFAAAGADVISAITMNNVNEAVGVARAAKAVDLPCVIAFTVETDGRLPTGDSLQSAIESVDEATGGSVAYFMINCAHPSHFADALEADEGWAKRIRGIRANASRCSHEELDAMTELDDGDPDELARELHRIRRSNPQITVLGGCCGTDHRHIAAIAKDCFAAEAA